MWQTLQNLLNNHFTNVIIQKLIKAKLVNNYRAYVRIKNKMIKMKHNSWYTLTKEWLGDTIWKIKQSSLKKTKLDFSLIVISKNLTSFVISKFPAWQSSYAWDIFATLPHEMGSRGSTKGNTQLIRQITFFDINQTSILFNKENTKV